MPQPVPQLRISEPAEIGQLVPYLVGFTPEESLVAIVIQDGRIQVTARADLTDMRQPGGTEYLLGRLLARFPAAEILAVAYTGDHQAGWDVLARCDNLLPTGCQAMLVDADRWHTPDGHSGTVDPYGTVAAQATYHGLQRLDHRTDLEARFASPPDSDQLDQQLGKALAGLPGPDEPRRIVQLTAELLDRNLPAQPDSPATISVTDAMQLSVLVQHPAARDLALLAIDHDNAVQHLQLWQQVVRTSPAYGAGMPLYLAGMAAWVSGDGASATIAVERSLAADPPPSGRHPAHLLEGILDNVLPPSAWDSLRADIAQQAHPDVARTVRPGPAQPAAPRGWPPATTPGVARRDQPGRRQPPAPGIAI
jgi:hypothetical protein